MNKNFGNYLDDFLMERVGEDIARLRATNKKYGSAAREYSELVRKSQNNEITDYRQAFDRLAELGEYIRDLECRCYFYTGMAMHKRIGDATESLAMPDDSTE